MIEDTVDGTTYDPLLGAPCSDNSTPEGYILFIHLKDVPNQ